MTDYRSGGSTEGLQELLQLAMNSKGGPITRTGPTGESGGPGSPFLSGEGRAIFRPSSSSPPLAPVPVAAGPTVSSSFLSSILPLRPRSSSGGSSTFIPTLPSQPRHSIDVEDNGQPSQSINQRRYEQDGDSYANVLEANSRSTTIAQVRSVGPLSSYGHIISVSSFGIAYSLGGKKVRLIAQQDGAMGLIEFTPEEQHLMLPIVDLAWYVEPQASNEISMGFSTDNKTSGSSSFHWLAALGRAGEVRIYQIYPNSRQTLAADLVLTIVFPEFSPARGLVWGGPSRTKPVLAIWGEGNDVVLLTFSAIEPSSAANSVNLMLTHKIFLTTSITDIVSIQFDPDGCNLAILGRDGCIEVYGGGNAFGSGNEPLEKATSTKFDGNDSNQSSNPIFRLLCTSSHEANLVVLKTWIHQHTQEELISVALLADRQTLHLGGLLGKKSSIRLPQMLSGNADWICLMDTYQHRDTLIVGSKEAGQPLFLLDLHQIYEPEIAICHWNINEDDEIESVAILDACCCSQVPSSATGSTGLEAGTLVYSFHTGTVRMTQIDVKWTRSIHPQPQAIHKVPSIGQSQKIPSHVSVVPLPVTSTISRPLPSPREENHAVDNEIPQPILHKPSDIKKVKPGASPVKSSSISSTQSLTSPKPKTSSSHNVSTMVTGGPVLAGAGEWEKVVTETCQRYLEREFIPRMEQVLNQFVSQLGATLATTISNSIQSTFNSVADQLALLKESLEETKVQSIDLSQDVIKSVREELQLQYNLVTTAATTAGSSGVRGNDSASGEAEMAPIMDLAYFETLVREGRDIQALEEVLELGDLELLDQLLALLSSPPPINQLSPQVILSLVQQLSLNLSLNAAQVKEGESSILERKVDWLTTIFTDLEPADQLYGGANLGGKHALSLRHTADKVLKELMEALRMTQKNLSPEVTSLNRRIKVLISLVRSSLPSTL